MSDQKTKSGSGGIWVWLLAGTGGYFLANYTMQERYPINVEYEIVNSCVEGSRGNLPEGLYLAKKERCLCALENSMDELPYDDFKEAPQYFAPIFRKSAKEC